MRIILVSAITILGWFVLQNKNIAFYAPIKPPDHHIPSGDRLIAKNIFKALEMTGANVQLASRYIAYSKRHAGDILSERKHGAIAEAENLLAEYETISSTDLPHIWVTYHPYCKAPDWLGPIVSKKLDIPYVTIEAAKTGQGGVEDFWQPWREEAQAGIKTADRHLVFKPTDKAYLSDLLGSEDRLFNFAPFIDAENISLAIPMELPQHWYEGVPILITTGMMRKGKKVDNFGILAETLTGLEKSFNLIIVGGGPEEDNIREAFSKIEDDRIHWTGIIDHSEVLRWMRSSDIFIWPGWKEPIGMVYLEAQLQELPIIAYESMGVPLVVRNDKTGFLAQEGNIADLASKLSVLLDNAELAESMGQNGRRKVVSHHGIKMASKCLDKLLSPLFK